LINVVQFKLNYIRIAEIVKIIKSQVSPTKNVSSSFGCSTLSCNY